MIIFNIVFLSILLGRIFFSDKKETALRMNAKHGWSKCLAAASRRGGVSQGLNAPVSLQIHSHSDKS
jgi:hypothetical protein